MTAEVWAESDIDEYVDVLDLVVVSESYVNATNATNLQKDVSVENYQ